MNFRFSVKRKLLCIQNDENENEKKESNSFGTMNW